MPNAKISGGRVCGFSCGLVCSNVVCVKRLLACLLVVVVVVGVRAQTAELDEIRSHAGKSEPEAQNTMGLAYKNGRGVAQDFAQALKWFRKAADQGNASAQKNVALMYA